MGCSPTVATPKLVSDKPQRLRAPVASRAHERELAELTDGMVELMAKRFKNQVLKELQAGTVAKFTDAQVGNYAVVFLQLAKRLTRKMTRQFNDDRIDSVVRAILTKAGARNQQALYDIVERKFGYSTKTLIAEEGLKPTTNALVLETAQWVKKLRDETLEAFTANTLRAMTQGGSLEEVMRQFDGLVEKRRNHARFTARTQIANFNGVSTKIRAQNLGITEAVWVTSHDERVRPCHKHRNGAKFELAKGCYSSCDDKWLLPGTDYQCRCTYDLIVPGPET